MNCRKDAAFKGMIAGITAGIISAFAVGYGVTKVCSRSLPLRKKTTKALNTVRKYIDSII